MAFKFKKAEFTAQSGEDFNYTSVGTLARNSKGKKMKFTKRNLASEKRVTLLLVDKNAKDYDDAETLTCSAPLSKVIRRSLKDGMSQREVMARLVNLEIMQNNDDEEIYYLCQPKGDGEALESFAVEELVKEKLDYADLIAF